VASVLGIAREFVRSGRYHNVLAVVADRFADEDTRIIPPELSVASDAAASCLVTSKLPPNGFKLRDGGSRVFEKTGSFQNGAHDRALATSNFKKAHTFVAEPVLWPPIVNDGKGNDPILVGLQKVESIGFMRFDQSENLGILSASYETTRQAIEVGGNSSWFGFVIGGNHQNTFYAR
jgi:hypothetical protein